MEPVRELQQATHFRKESDGAWSPCAADARGAKKMTLMEVRSPSDPFGSLLIPVDATR